MSVDPYDIASEIVKRCDGDRTVENLQAIIELIQTLQRSGVQSPVSIKELEPYYDQFELSLAGGYHVHLHCREERCDTPDFSSDVLQAIKKSVSDWLSQTMTTAEACSSLGIHRSNLTRWADTAGIKSVKQGRWRKQDIDRLKEDHKR